MTEGDGSGQPVRLAVHKAPRREPWMASLPGSDTSKLAQIGRDVAARLDADPRVSRIRTDLLDIFAMPGFVTPGECATLMPMIDAGVKPSTSLREDKSVRTRTSETCRFSAGDPLISEIDRRIATLLGLDLANGEGLQGQRYTAGQQFRMHNDYFASGQAHSQSVADEGGQRTWTAMAYLNRPEKGGQTAFAWVPLAIPPTPGVLLIWNNMGQDGEANPYSHHAGMPVEAGTKYVLTKWFREREWTPTGEADSYRA